MTHTLSSLVCSAVLSGPCQVGHNLLPRSKLQDMNRSKQVALEFYSGQPQKLTLIQPMPDLLFGSIRNTFSGR